MSIPLPEFPQYECRNETLEVYASDRRGEVSYQFNNFGYRNNIDYNESEPNVGIYIGSSITSAIGLDWKAGYPYISSSKLGSPCYHFSQGCVEVDNEQTLHMLKQIKASNLQPRYYVLQFINLDRRYQVERPTEHCTDFEENISRFYQTFSAIERELKDDVWCFIGCDGPSHNVGKFITDHPNCASWNFKYVDHAGVGQHPGAKWHQITGLAVSHHLSKKLG